MLAFMLMLMCSLLYLMAFCAVGVGPFVVVLDGTSTMAGIGVFVVPTVGVSIVLVAMVLVLVVAFVLALARALF